MRPILHLKKQATVSAADLKAWVREHVGKYYAACGMSTAHENFEHYVTESVHSVWQYLTSNGDVGAGGGASDLQCSLCLQAHEHFNVPHGRNVSVFIG